MPDTGIDIYIESSFFSVDPAAQDVYTSFITGLADNIGLRDTVANYQATPGISGVSDFYVEVYTSHSGAVQDGYNSTAIRYKTSTTFSGMAVSLVDYSIPVSVSGLATIEDVDLEYFIDATETSGALGVRARFIGSRSYDYSDNILGTYFISPSAPVENDHEVDYTAAGEYDPLLPGSPADQVLISGTDDARQHFTTASDINSGTVQQECDLFLAGYPMEFHPLEYTYRFDLVAGIEGDKQAAEWEAIVISGSVLDIPLDVTSTATASGYYNFDSVCGKTSFSGIDFPVSLTSYSFNSEVVSGTIGYFNGQAICGVSGTSGYGFDIDLLSLKISNFSLDIDEYTQASGTICVDITDDVHNVTPSESYFIIDETITSGTLFIPIVDGYTMCFDSPSDFADILGTTTFTVHAANDNGDILEQNFYVTSGYVVEYDNIIQDYDFGNQVVVSVSAENLAGCPNTGADAYFFTTTPKVGFDLGASIVGQPWGEKDLSAEIVPTTDTIYFYGKTFRIEIRAKDFAENVMEPFTFEFKIEDKPE